MTTMQHPTAALQALLDARQTNRLLRLSFPHADGKIELIGTEILIQGSKKVEVHGKDVDVNPSEG